MNFFRPRNIQPKSSRRTLRDRFATHLLALLILALAAIAGFFLNFPEKSLQRVVERELGTQLGLPVTIERARLAFPVRLRLEGLATSPALPVTVDRLDVSPMWLSIFSPQPGVYFSLESGEGELEGSIDAQRRLTAAAVDLPLTMPLPGLQTLGLNGTLTDASIDTSLGITPDKSSTLKLTIDDLKLTGLQALTGKIDELALGRLEMTVAGTGSTYRTEQLQLRGENLTAEGNLSLTPAIPLGASRISGSINLQPTANLPQDIAALLPLLGQPDRSGIFHLRLSGTLAAPRLR